MDVQTIHSKIYEIRKQQVMLDFDLADLYEVETRTLNQAVKRNADLFPDDFMFRLSQDKWSGMSSQAVMTYPVKRPKAARPFAFTEHGVAMLANVLKSKKARQTSIAIVRAFIALKQHSLNYNELARKIAIMEEKYQRQFNDVIEAINYLLNKDKQDQVQRKRKRIGF